MQLPKSEQLNIASLSRLFDNKAECYKLFWFQAILNHVCKGQQEIRFEELIDDIIANCACKRICGTDREGRGFAAVGPGAEVAECGDGETLMNSFLYR